MNNCIPSLPKTINSPERYKKVEKKNIRTCGSVKQTLTCGPLKLMVISAGNLITVGAKWRNLYSLSWRFLDYIPKNASGFRPK